MGQRKIRNQKTKEKIYSLEKRVKETSKKGDELLDYAIKQVDFSIEKMLEEIREGHNEITKDMCTVISKYGEVIQAYGKAKQDIEDLETRVSWLSLYAVVSISAWVVSLLA